MLILLIWYQFKLLQWQKNDGGHAAFKFNPSLLSILKKIKLYLTVLKNFLKFKGRVKIWSGRRDSNPRLQPWQG